MSFSITYQDVLVVVLAASVYGLWKVYQHWNFAFRSPLRNLPGPPSRSLIYGNVKDMFDAENYSRPDEWFAQYGKHFVDNGFLMTPRLWTLDPRALNHILTHYDDYGRPEENSKTFAELLGKGVLLVRGEEHRQQRRIMNPAFGPVQIRDLTEIFLQKADELARVWSRATKDGPARVNVNADLGKTTLDIIGLAGFGYDFHALNVDGKPSELNVAFRTFFANAAGASSLGGYLRSRFPILKYIPNARAKRVEGSAKVIRRVGTELVQTRKAALLREMQEKKVDGLQRQDLQGRDLLTLLIRANMAKDVPESQRLSDEDVIGQIPTFLIAGHETTSTSTTWALYSLSVNVEAQKKLREELLAVGTDTPSMDELAALPYLDMVVRETLRLHSPVTMLIREAAKDDVIPVSEPFTDRYGKVQHEIRIAKGNKVILPILALHRSKEIWGEDALEFKPERWEKAPDAIANVPGVWGHLLTFIGGPRACIGYRFSLIETKAILFSVIRAFEFELAVPAEKVLVKTAPLKRPFVRGEEGSQLPLILKPVKAA
ncbi:cytochrome P450 [Trametes coccinea BRFM310]|uniref:Cytochrome P450 n=1 Tax=Trametes coccinea (strain BRFM310) TaxID=1353009 RepID=A0A1Y2IHH5_TRAC3|nr:cytochrome P450 [Trametes coccinea BRFM310]